MAQKMKMTFHERLSMVAKQRTKAGKIKALREYGSKPLHFFLMHVLHPDVKFLLPEGDMPDGTYVPNPTGDSQNMMEAKSRELYLFIEGHPQSATIPQNRREHLWVQMLESVDPKDAELLIKAKDKKLPFKGITLDLVNEAYGPYQP
jgi:hypothetical protein